MKIAALVRSPDDISAKFRNETEVISKENILQIIEQFSGRSVGVSRFYLLDGSLVGKMLKFVEDFEGDMVCYFACQVSPVMLSRFINVENKRSYKKVDEFPLLSQLEKDLKQIKELL